jgi:hypothetical protein
VQTNALFVFVMHLPVLHLIALSLVANATTSFHPFCFSTIQIAKLSTRRRSGFIPNREFIRVVVAGCGVVDGCLCRSLLYWRGLVNGDVAALLVLRDNPFLGHSSGL